MRILLTSILFFIITSCSSYMVKRDYDENYKFRNISTYFILNDQNTKLKANSLIGKRAISPLREQLALKNIKEADKKNADVLILVHFIEKNYIQPSGSSIGVGIGRSGRGGFGGISVGRDFGGVREYDSLRISFTDAKSNEQIWTVEARGKFDSNEPQKTKEYFKKALTEMFKKYPQ